MKSDMDNKEWADEEVSLKRFIKNNPFTVPVGYFEEAGQRILSVTTLEGLKTDDAAQGFTVPDQYFDTLNAAVNSRINLQEAIDTQQPGFLVPDGYFEQLAGHIQSRINIETTVDANEKGFAVPAGYFDHLPQQIKSRLTVEEALENTGAFTVPDHYFDTLTKSILNKTVNQDMVARKPIVRKLFASNTFKYATAACLALIIGTGVFLREAAAPVTHTRSLLHTQLSEVPVDEIKDYLELRTDGTETLIENDKQINTEALDANLQDYTEVN